MNMNVTDNITLHENHEKHGLRGHVQVFRQNKETGEKTLWYENDNVISISGYQWLLMKMFGLHLDAEHNNGYEKLDQDTNLIIPDLNSSGELQIGVDPVNYDPMIENIASNHIVQGFMIGTGGSGEDAITTKNTDYSFIRLRNPIPFQQTQSNLDPSISGKYLGNMRVGSSSFSKSYYIKKFDSTPHIYHSWWRDGQRWDYVDTVGQEDLGPNSRPPKTNRIETYAQVEMSIDTDAGDCISYFSHEGSTQTAAINELGLVAFDTKLGTRSVVIECYNSFVKDLIRIIFDNARTDDEIQALPELIDNTLTIFESTGVTAIGYSNITNFISTLETIKTDITNGTTLDFNAYQFALGEETNLSVEAHYNQNGMYLYAIDTFLDTINSSAFDTLSDDQAQRIKLITYYTFNAIPLQTNWKILINYRIYAN